MMTDLQFLSREIGLEIANYCKRNDINFFYQIIIQLIALFLLGIIVYIYEECCKRKEIKLKLNNNFQRKNDKKKKK